MQPTTQQETNRFMYKVFGWMFAGLAVSGLTSYFVAITPTLTDAIFGTPFVFYGILIAEFLLVISLVSMVQKMSASFAILMFLLYSVATGLTLSVIFLVYTIASIGTVFFITAGTFGVMSIYGYVTKTDLTATGNLLFMGLIGVILSSIVNMFFQSDMVSFVTSIISVIIFTGLTAYDVQKIKEFNIIGNEGTEQDTKESIMGALSLYLDFINLFLSLLRLFGKRR